MEKIESEKEYGNQAYKQGIQLLQHTAGKTALNNAGMHYAKSLDFLDAIYDPQNQRHVLMKRALLLNLAALGLKLQSYNTVIECCTEVVMHLDSMSSKAYYRRAQAYVALGKLEDALDDYAAAAVLQPGDKTLQASIKTTQKLVNEAYRKEQLQLETERGRERMEKKKQNMELFAKSDALENGGENSIYAWGQSVNDIQVLLKAPCVTSSKQVTCTMHRHSLDITINTEEGLMTVFDRPLHSYIDVEESSWMIENNQLQLLLRKQRRPENNDNCAPETCWWTMVFEGETPIDISELSNTRSGVEHYTPHERIELKKKMNLLQQESPETIQSMQEEQRVADEMERQAIRRNPEKGIFAKQLRAAFPDTQINIR